VSTAAYQASGAPEGGFDGSSPNGEAPEGDGSGTEAGDETVEGEFKEV
jgi:hypothetical protein